ncbi:uncharacterized protein TRAVEDRAFT_42139 [Trametes versicolor FP-101664 SS1]|uniref:uncharacterized protein n=1 Tax=Trametes versicolor (strain FP-101664) TaxID=717944 RepID=UPI00046216A6|nr:uncharacterized protein TRAVEDRAFT_42139 [Trametes versicolor FP-101664 SS1]EIW64724.1 hypothetical protein TRAVEDRAFT_42139 [Trametes versicolor FP-101664 SS1]
MSRLAELEQALNEEKARLLRLEAEEAERERTRQAEEVERARQAPEPSGSGKGAKRKAPEEGEKVVRVTATTACDRCAERGEKCEFNSSAPRVSSCVNCQRAKEGACVGAKGLPRALQRRVDNKEVKKKDEESSPARKKARTDEPTGAEAPKAVAPKPKSVPKSAAIIVDEDEDGVAPEVPEVPVAPKGRKDRKGKEKALPDLSADETDVEGPGGDFDIAEGPGEIALDDKDATWSKRFGRPYTDRELVYRLLVECQKNRQELARLREFLDGEEDFHRGLLKDEARALRETAENSVSAVLKKSLGSGFAEAISADLRDVVREEVNAAVRGLLAGIRDQFREDAANAMRVVLAEHEELKEMAELQSPTPKTSGVPVAPVVDREESEDGSGSGSGSESESGSGSGDE